MNNDGIDEVIGVLDRLQVDRRHEGDRLNSENWWETSSEMAITPDQLKTIVDTAITAALRVQKQSFEKQIEDLVKRVNDVTIKAPEIETFEEIQIIPGRSCDESLDVIKSLPDFEGKPETYVSWRQAAHTAYKIFEKFEGSSKHYMAVAIIRNKVKGPADMVLSSFNTVLNFKAIIARLDFTYSDKRPIYLIEQELSTLRQGNLTLLEYYDEVEKKLTLLVNKTIMTYDREIASSINEKYRMDALRVFISGTRKGLSDVLFAARPSDLPSALALAQEVESNHQRYQFATNYARSLEYNKRNGPDTNRNGGNASLGHEARGTQPAKNPYFAKNQGFTNRFPQRQDAVEPMDIDQSSRFRQTTKFQPMNNAPAQNQMHDGGHAQYGRWMKRPKDSSARLTGPKHQRINHISHEDVIPEEESEYHEVALTEATEIDDEIEAAESNFVDEINFLGETPCCRS